MTNERITEADLHAYADGLLDDARRAEVDAWLATRPEQAAEIAAWQRQSEGIHALYDPVAAQQVPARLSPNAIAAGLGRGSAWSWQGMAAAAAVLIALGIGSGYLLRGVIDTPDTPATLLVENAVTAHALYVKENRHAVEVAASEQQHLVSWLSNRIEADIDAPDLTAEGFTLVGGRLLPAALYTEAGPAAQLMYENAAAERLTVYITGALPDKSTAYEFVTVASLDAFYWANDQITCTVVGALPDAEMQTVAKKVYQQLTRRPDYQRGT
jgi:anti-sigma factor RsiW